MAKKKDLPGTRIDIDLPKVAYHIGKAIPKIKYNYRLLRKMRF